MSKIKAALIRAARTAAQAALASLGAGAVNLASIPWTGTLGLAGGAAVVSLLTSVVTDLPEVG